MKNIIYPFFYSFRFVFKNSPFYAISLIITSFINTYKVYVTAALSKNLINLIAESLSVHRFNTQIIYVSVTLIAFEIFLCVFSATIGYFSIKSSIKYSNNMTLFLCDLAYKLKFSFFDDSKNSDQAAQAKSDCQYVLNMYSSIVNFVFGCISFIVSLVICIKLNVFFAIVAVLVTLPNFFIQKKARVDNYEHEKELNFINRKLGYFNSIFWGREYYMESHLFDLKKFLFDNLTKYQDIRTEKQMRLTRKNTIRETCFIVLILLVNGIINLGIILLIIYKRLTVGDYSYYNTILNNLKNTTNNTVRLVNEIINCHTRINNFLAFVDEHVKTESAKKLPVPTEINSIEVKDLWFMYPNTNVYVLENVSFKINSNERIAFAGINGAGKTTLISLLLRYYTPTKGMILLNGINIEEYDIVQYRNLFSTMFQIPIMYYLTMRENIAISKVYAPPDEECIKDCLRKSEYEFGLNNLDSELSKQFDSDGIIPSQGQLQKINLAKTIYRDANIVILDEPSASLDALSEHNIFSKMYELSENRIMILVSHRLSNLKSMDRIYYFENHTIVESGTHEDLLNLNGYYRKIYEIQASGY